MILPKKNWRELAIFDQPPAFLEALHVNRPYSHNKQAFIKHVDAIFASHVFSNHGPLVRKMETRLAEILNVKHCILTSNGTLALALIVRALGIRDEVIIPSFNFISTAHMLQWQGIKPVFCDISPVTWNIDPQQCEKLISKRTTAIIGTHLWGRPCDIEALEQLAHRHNLYLLFDAAHAFGCSHKGRLLGIFGNAEALSFHATKAFHTFEGGAVTTNDDSLAEKIKIMRNFGFTEYDHVASIGLNAKMPEVCAAMGLSNIDSIDEFFSYNQSNYHYYKDILNDIPACNLVEYNTQERHNYHYIVLRFSHPEGGLSRDQIMQILHKENILARRYFYPGNHLMQPYASQAPAQGYKLPQTELISDSVLLLPNGSSINYDHIKEIGNIIRVACNNFRKIAYFIPNKLSI